MKCNDIIILMLLVFYGCNEAPLPILGEKDISEGDTTYYEIPDFRYLDQDSNWITPETFDSGFYVADFFFTSCPSICPKVKKQMLRINEALKGESRLKFLSYSIDYLNDSIPRLKSYAEKLHVDADRWHFVQLGRDFEKTANLYFNVAFEDGEAPGGFDHSGRLILVDDKKHIRSYCLGTDPEEVDRLISDINKLSEEYDQR